MRRYFFSVTADVLRRKPWRRGSVYLLPRKTFVPDHGRVQWLSSEPVKPLARLSVSSKDFPLLHYVFGSNDTVFRQRLSNSLVGFPYTDDVACFPIRPDDFSSDGSR